MSKISIVATVLVAGLISPLGAFAQGSAGTGNVNRHRGAGRPRRTRNTKPRLDPATGSSDEHCDNRKRQSQPVTKKFDTASKCGSEEWAGVSEIIAAG
jgi:hypothetical protein